MRLILLTILIFEVLAVCPNYCSGHGICSEDDVCTCFKAPGLDTSYFSHPQYVGGDCSERSCPYGESFAVIPNQKYNVIEKDNSDSDSDENGRLLEEFSNFEVSLIDSTNYEVVEINKPYPLLGKAGGIMNCNRSSTDIYRSCRLNNLNVMARQENKYLIYWPEEESISCNGTLTNYTENPILYQNEYLSNCKVIYERRDLSTMISNKINKIHNNNIGIMSIEGISQLLEYYNYYDNETYNLACIYSEETLQMKIYPSILYLYSQIEENNNKDNNNNTINGDDEYNSTDIDGNDMEILITKTNGKSKSNSRIINDESSSSSSSSFDIPPVDLPGSVIPPPASHSSHSSSSSPFLNNLMKNQQKIKQQHQQQNNNNKRFLKEQMFENKIKSLSSIFNKPPPPTNYDFNMDINKRKLSEDNNNNNNNNENNEDDSTLSRFQKYLKLVDNEIVSGDKAIFITKEPVLPDGQCFLLGNTNGENITIGKSDLMKYLRYENNKYYFGPNINPNNAFSSIINGSSIDYIENSEIDINDEELRNNNNNGIIFELSQLFSHQQIKSSLIQLTSGSKLTITFLSPTNGVYMKIYTINKVKFYNIDGEELDNEGNIISSSSSSTTTQPTTTTPSNSETETDSDSETRILQQQQNQNQKKVNLNEIYVAMITDPPFTLVDEETTLFLQIQSNTIHEFVECSGAGLCNRNTGKCECFSGYSGIACQRLRCPNDCSNHGKCVTYDEAIKGSNYKNQIKQQFGYSGSNSLNEKFFGCLCEKGYRGSDCSMKECPSYEDPQSNKDIKKNNEFRDCSGRGICNYDIGICECFNGYSGAGCEVIMPTDY